MAVLSDADRLEGAGEYMRENKETVTCLKPDIRAAYNAVDQYLSDNATAINAAIPQPARSALSTTQKALLLTAVVRKRYLSEV